MSKCPMCRSEEIVSIEVVGDDNDKFMNSSFLMVAGGGYQHDTEVPYLHICKNCGIVYKPKGDK